MSVYKVGDRVNINVDSGGIVLKDTPATITYIDQSALFIHHFYPIQIELDSPYDESGQTMLRVSLKEIKPIVETEEEVE